MYLGWYDPDKKYPTLNKLNDAIERYVEKYGIPPVLCLCNPVEAAELAQVEMTIEVRGVPFIPRNTFYVGFEEVEDGVKESAAA